MTFGNILDTAEEGPHLIDRMSDHEALPDLDLRLPIGFDPRRRRCGARGGPNACGGKGRCGAREHFAGAPRSGRPQSLAAASGDGFDPARPPVEEDSLHRAHDANITCASAEIAAHGDADIVLA